MSEFNIKKLNVRSPYYITVSRKKDKVVDGEDCERDENGECIVDDGDDGTVSETKDNRKFYQRYRENHGKTRRCMVK